jgi:hypothetical protein
MNAFAQLFNGFGQIYLNVAFIFCVFGILSFKPDRIANISQFKLGCMLFSVSLVIPMIGSLFPGDVSSPNPLGMPTKNSPIAMQIFSLLSIVLYASGFFATVLSVLPTRVPSSLE